MSSHRSIWGQQRQEVDRSAGPSSGGLRVSGSGPIKITHKVTHKITITAGDGTSSPSSRSQRSTLPVEYPSVYPPRDSTRGASGFGSSSGASRAPQLLPSHMGPPPPLSRSSSTMRPLIEEGPRSHSRSSRTMEPAFAHGSRPHSGSSRLVDSGMSSLGGRSRDPGHHRSRSGASRTASSVGLGLTTPRPHHPTESDDGWGQHPPSRRGPSGYMPPIREDARSRFI